MVSHTRVLHWFECHIPLLHLNMPFKRNKFAWANNSKQCVMANRRVLLTMRITECIESDLFSLDGKANSAHVHVVISFLLKIEWFYFFHPVKEPSTKGLLSWFTRNSQRYHEILSNFEMLPLFFVVDYFTTAIQFGSVRIAICFHSEQNRVEGSLCGGKMKSHLICRFCASRSFCFFFLLFIAEVDK